MAVPGITKWIARPEKSAALRYGLAFASVAVALLLEFLFQYLNAPHPFAALALSAIAITFWYGGTKPGIVAVLLSLLIRGYLFGPEVSSLDRVLYDLVFVIFAVLMSWLRRRRSQLEAKVADRTVELRAANADLQRQKEHLGGLFDLAPDAVILTDENFRVLRVNKEFTRMFGYAPEEAVGQWLPDLIVPEESRADALKYRVLLASGQRVYLEAVRQRKGGARFHTSVAASRISPGIGQVAIYLIYRDISARKESEEKLRRSEASLLEGQRLSHTGSWMHDLSSGVVIVSPEVLRIFDAQPGEDTSAAEFHFSRIHPEDRPMVERDYARARTAKADFEFDYRALLPDGTIKHIHNIGHPILNDAGEIVEYVGTAMDVTEQRRARAELESAFESLRSREVKLRESEQELRQLIEFVPAHVFVLQPDAKAFYANRVVLDYYGLTLEEWQAEGLLERVVHPEDLDRYSIERQEGLASLMPFEIEARIRGKDGQYRWFLGRFSPLKDERGRILHWYGVRIDIEETKQTAERARNENLALREEVVRSSMFEEIVGSSDALLQVLSEVARVAPADSTVLILGETGTGKELIARAIHKQSGRSARAFIRVNCASIPPSLIASELFGHEKGAFTGALQRRQGRFELANSGTIFLDEIGELPAETQVALLRVLQERQFERVGGNQVLSVDVRVIAATNRDLSAAIAAGTFRADLFYRLNVFPIEVPSLRQRKADIPMLVEYFVKRYAEKVGKQIRKIDRSVLELCQAYQWPGNIRELQNIVERSVILCTGDTFRIDEAWLSSQESSRSEPLTPLTETLQNQEKEMIEAALAESNGRVAGPNGAAAKLGIPRSTLDWKIKQLKIKKYKFTSQA
jgi:PAS domain S-box-containing protein